jgi:hypothetical protein
MSENKNVDRGLALQTFHQARKQANRQQLGAKLTGTEKQLLPFDAVRAELRLKNPMYKGIVEVPLEQIVGSIGRYREFTRNFLPLNDGLKERWVGVETLAGNMGWPPIEVYRVGDIFFVKDGNHRTAVARQMGLPTIEAKVWDFPEDIHIDPNASLDTILIQLGERTFQASTNLDELYPDHGIRFTAPGRYNELFAQIEDFRQKLELIDGEEKTMEETVPFWYEMVYLPTIQIIDESELDELFPGRTQADLFVWISKHRTELGDLYGDYDNLADLVLILADRYSESPLGRLARRAKQLVGVETLPELVEPEEARIQLEIEQIDEADENAELAG